MVTNTKKDLLERNRELQARLDEAEETLRALRSGEVDAIVVSGPDGDQVYTIKGADEAYRVMVENMAEGAVTLTPDGLILYSNEQFAFLLGLPLERVIGSAIRDFIAEEDGIVLSAVLFAPTRAEAQLRLKTGSAALVPVHLSASRLWLDGVECVCLIVTDLTEQTRNQGIIAAERLASSILEQAAGALLVIDPGGKIIRASRAAEQLAKKLVLLHQFDEVFCLRIKSDAIADAAIEYTFTEIFATVQRHGKVADLEAVALMPDGRMLDVIISAGVLTGAQSECLGCIVLISDVSGMKRVEQALRESESRERARAAEFEALMDAAPVSIFRSHDAECRWVDGNRAAYDLLRRPRGSNLSKPAPEGEKTTNFRVMKDGIDIAQPELPMQKTAATGQAVRNFEAEFELVDGSTVNILGHAVPLLDENGRPRGAIGAFLDITGRKQADAALRESEERYRTLFDLSPIGVYSCDASGVILEFNDRAVALWGRKPTRGDSDERWCGSFKLHRPDGAFLPRDQCPMAEVLSGTIPEARDQEVQIERPDGSRITVIVNIRPLKNERGEILGAINCFVDITERKQAEEARAQLAAIVESSQDAMISKTLEGKITSWNKGAERLFGYTAEEAIGENITFIVPPDRLPEEATILDRLSRGERVEHFETRRIRKDGTLLDISLTISPVKDIGGRIVGASKVARDITERKMAEKALREAHDRLESTVEQRTASVRQLSLKLLTVQDEEHRRIARELHDSVVQDLAVIKMSVDRLPQVKSPNQQTALLAQLSESLDKCVSELRTISYLLHPPLIDEAGFASAAQWFIKGFSERSGIKVDLELSNQSKRLPRSIELPLFRILQASLSNVHRHAHSPSADVRFTVNGEEAQLEVKDFGTGIDHELLERFNRSGAGAGIGLAGMRERLREMGGRLEIQSDASGTLIRAVIPLSAFTKAKKTGSAA